MIDVDFVLTAHRRVAAGGVGLFGGVNEAALSGALARVAQHRFYVGLDDVFEIAAFYAVALARAHAFSDGNKRTATAVMLAYLDLQGIEFENADGLDEVMVQVAAGFLDASGLAAQLRDFFDAQAESVARSSGELADL